MKHTLKALSLFGLLWAGSAGAVLIDSFDSGDFTVSNDGSTDSGNVATTPGDAIGDTHRGVLLGGSPGSTMAVAAGRLGVFAGSFGGTVAQVIWDNFGTEDLTEGGTITGIQIDVVAIDNPTLVNMVLTVHEVANQSSISLNVPGTGIRFFNFDLFTDQTVLDNADLITLDIEIDADTDLLIDIIETRVPTDTPVPAPAPLLLMSAGILGIRFLRKSGRA